MIIGILIIFSKGASLKASEDDGHSESSVSAVIMLILQYTENPGK